MSRSYLKKEGSEKWFIPGHLNIYKDSKAGENIVCLGV